MYNDRVRLTAILLLGMGTVLAQTPERDVRLSPDFLADLIRYKQNFRRPDWAHPALARQVRFDGGPMFAASQIESGWDYLFDPKTPGFVGVIQAVPSEINFYTQDIESRLDAVKAAGYNWIWLSYDLGFALADEEEQRSQVRNVIRLAHARGMRVTAYVSLTSLFIRSIFLRQPESKAWVQERPDGQPVAYASVPVRLMACVNKPGRLDYLKRVVEMAVRDGADDIHYDSIFNRCYCAYCRKGFREYSKRVLGRAYDPPVQPSAQAPADIQEREVDTSTDPVWELFVEYSGYTVAKALAELDRCAKAKNPSVTLSANTHQIRYVDQVTDMTWSEDANTRGSRISEGKLVTPLAVYAWGQALSRGQKPFQATVMPEHYWTVQEPRYYERTAIEAAAFQANFTMLAGYAFGSRMFRKEPETLAAWNGIGAGLRFVERNVSLYANARPAADMALYYSHASRTLAGLKQRKYDWEGDIEELLLAGVPSTILFDDQALSRTAAELLREYRLIDLRRAYALSGEELELFRRYAERGGSLLVSSETGTYDNFFVKRRSAPLLANAKSVHLAAADQRLSVEIAQALGRRPAVELSGGNGFQLAVLNTSGRSGVVHLVNYDNPAVHQNLRVRLRPTASTAWNRLFQTPLRATWIPAPTGEAIAVPVQMERGSAEITIRRVDVGGLIVLTPAR